jgi:fido (protein-threonine AMPylation protein)
MNHTLSEIDKIIGRINTHLEYSSCVNREESHALREEAEGHSLDIELLNEGLRVGKKERALSLDRLNQAEKFLAQQGIGLYSLSKLGALIEPERNSTGTFRNEVVKFGDFYSIDPQRVPFRIDNLIHLLEDPSIPSVLRASNLHLEFVEIHPYMDGNGRAARLLQNFCLQQRGYPSAIIQANERKTYISLLENAIKDRYSDKTSVYNQSSSEKDFHEFIASKVFDSSRILEKELAKSRMYTLNISQLKDPQIARTVANQFKALSRLKNGGGIAVSINKSNGYKKAETLKIRGDVGYDQLRQVLERDSAKYGFKYKLETDACSSGDSQ